MTTETKTRIVVVTDQYTGEAHRFNITGAVKLTQGLWDYDLEQRDWSTGIDLENVYLQPRAKRVIVEFHSRWEDRSRPGRTQGTYFVEADNDLIAKLAQKFDCEELAALLPEFTDA